MVVFDAIVVGSGPGGCACARVLAKAGKRVLILERGRALGEEADCCGSYSGCAILARVGSLRRVPSTSDDCIANCPFRGSLVGNSVGGASNGNLGVWIAPSEEELRHAFPAEMRNPQIVRSFLREVDAVAGNANFERSDFANRLIQAETPAGSAAETDTCKVLETPFLKCRHNGRTVLARHMSDRNAKRRNVHDLLCADVPGIITIARAEVERIEEDPHTHVWTAFVAEGSCFRGTRIFVACSALETPAFLLKTFGSRCGHAIGRNVLDHFVLSHSISVVGAGYEYDANDVPIDFISVDETGKYGAEVLKQHFTFSAFAKCALPVCALPVGRSVLENWLCCLLPPKGWLSNLFCCCCVNGLRLQVMHESNADGEISLKQGRAFFRVPTSNEMARSKARAFGEGVKARLAAVAGVWSAAATPSRLQTAYHFVGSCRAPSDSGSDADAAVDLHCRPLSKEGKPLSPTLFVSDNSLPRSMCVGNTQALAAFCGVVAANRALDLDRSRS